MEMTEAIPPELVRLEKDGIEAYDALQQPPVLVFSPVMCIVADNPRASEILNHLGATLRKYCRMCVLSEYGSCTLVFVCV